MKCNYISFVLLFSLIFTGSTLSPHGFCAGTLIHTKTGLIPIENCRCGDYVYNNLTEAYPISHTRSYLAPSCIAINTTDNEYIYCSPDQMLYTINKNKWIKASDLEPNDVLLGKNDSPILITKINIIKEQQKIYTLSVETSNIFCVGSSEIVAHNIEPTTTTATVITSIILCPPAGAAIAIGEIIACGVAGFIAYRIHKNNQKKANKKDGCFTIQNEPKTSDCRIAASPIESMPACTFPINDVVKNHDCRFPIEVVQDTYIQKQDNPRDPNTEKDQYNGPWYNRTEDWINEHPFGQKIKKSLERSQYINQGKRAFEVLKNIDECDGFKKGDYIVVDALHRDHLEVFDKNQKWKQVANFDGTKNIDKTRQGMKETRRPLEIS